MRFFKFRFTGIAVFAAVPAAIISFVLLFTDTEAGRMVTAFDWVSSQVSHVTDQILKLSSPVAEAAVVPVLASTPAPSPAPLAAAAPSATPSPDIYSSRDESPLPDEDINKIPLEYYDQSVSADEILDDKFNLISQDFKIPLGLKPRVAFWFDIYTKYSSHFVLIHDANHPWIVYRVVDLRNIYEQPVNRFVKDANDKRAVAKARNDVRRTLWALSRKRNFQRLSEEEYKLYKILEDVPGPRRVVFARAARSVRDQRGQKDFFKKGLIVSSRYLSDMEQIFAQYDLPIELVRLPLVESSFNLAAESKVGASGIWQFMLGMGKHYLQVNRYADERNSPLKATEAAAKLMLSNFRVLHSWPLAITAYNHGAGGVAHACKVLHSRSITDLVNRYHSRSFSFASENFYSEFLAALYGEKYQDQVFGPMLKYTPLQAEFIDLKYSMRAKTLCDLVGMTVEELKLYNPDLRAQAIARATFLPVGYHLRLPLGRKARLELFYQQAEEAKQYVNSLERQSRRSAHASRSQGHG